MDHKEQPSFATESNYVVVGAFLTPDGEAPVALGDVLVQHETSKTLFRAQKMGPSPGAILNPLISVEASYLERTGQLLRLQGSVPWDWPLVAWALRPSCPDRAMSTDLLYKRELVALREQRPSGEEIFVVRHGDAHALRKELAAAHYKAGIEAFMREDWEKAERHANVAIIFDYADDPDHLALLVLALERSGRKVASEGVLQEALNNTWDKEWNDRVRDSIELLGRIPAHTPVVH